MASRDLTYNLIGKDVSASSTFSATADAGESMTSRIGAGISSLGQKIGGELGSIVSEAGDSLEQFGEHGLSASAKMGILGAGVAGVGVALMSLGSADKAAEQQLAASVNAAGESVDDYKKQIDDAVNQGENFGHSAADVNNALNTLVTKTGDLGTALSDMTLVENLAAAKHEDLASAAQQVGQALDGNTRLFKQYGIAVGTGAMSVQEITADIGLLNQKLSGQAAAATDTFTGKIDSLKEHALDLASRFGNDVGPALTFFGTGVSLVSGVVDIFAARTARMAEAQIQAGLATKGEGGAAAESVAPNEAAAASQDELAAAADKNATAQEGSKLATAGALGGLALLVAGTYEGGKALNGYLEANNSFAKVLDNSGKAIAGFTDAIDQDNGALGANTEKALAAQVQQDGLSNKLAKSGIGLAEVTTALTQNDQQFATTIATWQQAGRISGNTEVALSVLHAELDKGKLSAQQYQTALTALGVSGVTPVITTFDDLTTQLNDAAVAQTATATQTQMAYLAMVNEGDQAGLLKLAMDGLNTSILSVDEAQTNLWDATTQNTTAIEQNRTKTVDGSTASVAAQKAIQGQETAIQALMEANIAGGMSTQQATKLANDQGQAFLGQIAKTDGAKSAIYTYAQSILNIPAVAETRMTVDDAEALQAIQDYNAKINLIARGINVGMSAPEPGSGLSYATGGVIGMAGGGISRLGGVSVDEFGSELLDMGTMRVYPHGQSDQMKRGLTASSGSPTYITINMPTVTAPSAQDGRNVAAALERFVGQGGKVRIGKGVN